MDLMNNLPATAQEYDAIVIGSGQGGTPLSRTLAEAGLRTALIEREHVGGTCLNEGCTPTKTMVASGRVAYLTHRAIDYGVRTGPISVDMGRVRQRKRGVVNSFRNGSQKRLEKTANLELIFGDASFTGHKSLQVRLKDGGLQAVTAERIFINAGTRASRPPIEGLDRVPFLDNVSIMELDALPEHLLVLGGGYVGLEFGQMFRRFGSLVTIVQSRGQLLSGEDPDIGQEVAKILQQEGVEVLLKAKAQRLSQSEGRLKMEIIIGDKQRTIEGSHLIVATGRVPNSDRLNLEAAGIQTDARGFIKVNNRLETNVAGVYALGDIKGGPAFTHISYDDFRIIRANLLEKKNVTTDNRLVPYTLFIDPQLGRIGLSENQAREAGRKFRVAKLAMSSVARAIEMDETRGFIKAIVDAGSDQILGAAILGVEGGEVMAVLEVAMMGKLPYTLLRDGIFAHPTLAESLNNLFMAMDQK
jgi:pyruvate/2-oxoglutarate dehydrogenase complex dihydrolipoamide dehydrogenase (E3) component